ncbi:MAG: arginine-tRNA-protein transferase [Chloracidobacterium sp.]|nr:arginine-tRNA-protein transferase [Chloracidobacterium sp.]
MKEGIQKPILEHMLTLKVGPDTLDELYALGWRHSGLEFYRYNLARYKSEWRNVIPLRIRLSEFRMSRSQRRTASRNSDTRTVIRPAYPNFEADELFMRHSSRFDERPPSSLAEYLFIPDPARVPSETLEAAVFKADRLIATSYFDVGRESVSGIYAMFEPDEERRRLGIYTMLKEIEFAIASGRSFYYLGYTYEGCSFYDYKKQFIGTEAFDWEGRWEPFARRGSQ